MTRAAMLAWSSCALAACGGDVYYVEVRPADNPSPIECSETRALVRLTSVKVGVIREAPEGLEEIPNLGSCKPIGPTNHVADMLAPFEEAGVYVSGAPAGNRTLLRFIGYTGRASSCLDDTWAVCGITCPLVRQGEVPEDGVEAHFICDGFAGTTEHQVFVGCLNLDQLTEEARARMCDPEATPDG